MARRPFFSGNYGSALGSYDTAARLLAGAGQAQGQMFANLGADIGGAIEKYQLNKEKRDEAQRSLEANIGYMAQNDPETLAKFKQEYAKDFAALEKDGGNAKTISNLNAGMAVWKDRLTADLNRNLKESQVRNLDAEGRLKTLQGNFDELTQDDRRYAVHNETYATTLANQGEELKQKLLKAKDKREEEGIEREIELHVVKVEGAKGANLEGSNRRKLFEDTYEDTTKKIKADRQIAEAEVLINKAKPALMKAQTKLTQMQALGQNIENQAEETGKKYTVGEVVTKKGSDYIWTGNTLQPIAGQITQATLDSAALRIWGDELLLYYQDTRDDQTGKVNDPEDIDPKKERLLIMMKMGTLDDIEGIEDDELKNKLKTEIEGLLATPESPSTGGDNLSTDPEISDLLNKYLGD